MPSDDRDPVDVLAEEFADRLRRGEHPSVSAYAAKHPEHAEQLNELLPAVAQMELLKRFRAARREVAPGPTRRLPHRPRTRPRRHGCCVRGRTDLARPARRAQDPRAARAARHHPARAVRPRGAGRGEAAPHQHRAGVRRRRAGRAAVLRDAAHPRAWPQRARPAVAQVAQQRQRRSPARDARPNARHEARGHPAARQTGSARTRRPGVRRLAVRRRGGHAGGRRAPLRAQAGHPPPRREAGQPHPRRRNGVGHRLRPRQADERGRADRRPATSSARSSTSRPSASRGQPTRARTCTASARPCTNCSRSNRRTRPTARRSSSRR